MSKLRIEGGHRLSGRVEVEGNKNSALPLLAACLLTSEPCVLTNVPLIRDVEVMARLLVDLGAEVDGIGTTTLRVRCREVVKDEPDPVLVGRLRGSVLLLGPLLARRGRARLAPPGGDFPARRTLATHLEALVAMGTRVADGPDHQLEVPDGLKPTSIYLFEASVTATETAILAAVAAPGVSEIRNAACEPHVAELCVFLQQLGAGITGGGTSTIRIEGGATLRRRGTSTVGRLHRSRELGGGRRGHRRRDRGVRREARGHRGGGRRPEAVARPLRDERRRVSRRSVQAESSRAHHHRLVAGISKRPGQSRDRAGHPGRGPDARSTTGCTSCGSSPSSS